MRYAFCADSPLRDPELHRLSDWENDYDYDDRDRDLSGNEADADDTSIDSRTSSRIMGESVDSLGIDAAGGEELEDDDEEVVGGGSDDLDLNLLPGGAGATHLLGGAGVGRGEALGDVDAGAESDFFHDDANEGNQDDSKGGDQVGGGSAAAPAPVRELKC